MRRSGRTSSGELTWGGAGVWACPCVGGLRCCLLGCLCMSTEQAASVVQLEHAVQGQVAELCGQRIVWQRRHMAVRTKLLRCICKDMTFKGGGQVLRVVCTPSFTALFL